LVGVSVSRCVWVWIGAHRSNWCHTRSYVTDASAANTLWVGDGTGKFTDGTAAAGVGDTGMGQGASFADIDGDGDLVPLPSAPGSPVS
jgi:hypothetical protein